jgi:RNA 2',3'-cyclic 3'-phosphodiesterase
MAPTRVFVGIPIQTDGALHFLREHPLYSDLPVHWIREEDLHMTLIPPWSTSNVERERERLRSLSGLQAIPYFFHTVESTPRWPPRVLWVRGDPVEELVTLKHTVEQVFHKKPEQREFRRSQTRQERLTFRPHVTIARFIFDKVNGITNPIAEPFAWGVKFTSICLYSSHVSAHGSWYERIEQVILNS